MGVFFLMLSIPDPEFKHVAQLSSEEIAMDLAKKLQVRFCKYRKI